jgi:hypothetical protein
MIDDLEEMPKTATGDFYGRALKVERGTVLITAGAMSTGTQLACPVEYISDTTGGACLFASAAFVNKMTSTMTELPESDVQGNQMVDDPMGELADTSVGDLKDAMAWLN